MQYIYRRYMQYGLYTNTYNGNKPCKFCSTHTHSVHIAVLLLSVSSTVYPPHTRTHALSLFLHSIFRPLCVSAEKYRYHNTKFRDWWIFFVGQSFGLLIEIRCAMLFFIEKLCFWLLSSSSSSSGSVRFSSNFFLFIWLSTSVKWVYTLDPFPHNRFYSIPLSAQFCTRLTHRAFVCHIYCLFPSLHQLWSQRYILQCARSSSTPSQPRPRSHFSIFQQ